MCINMVILITTLFGLGFLVPIILRKWKPVWKLSLFFALLGSLCGAVLGLRAWLNIMPHAGLDIIPNAVDSFQVKFGSIIAGMPALEWEFKMDALSAFFCFLIAAFAAAVAVYSFAALGAKHYENFKTRIASAFNLFVWSTIMVVLVHDAFSLILVLEIMTLAFGYLVLYKHKFLIDEKEKQRSEEKQQSEEKSQSEEKPQSEEEKEKHENARLAPQVYMMISHTGTAFLMIALLILAIGAKSFGFEQLAQNGRSLGQGLSSVVFLLAFSGLAIRAGLVPAHFWVSLVHPSSPTTTHALSLGIAIKVAVYSMYRFFFQFLSPQPWWGYLLLSIAAITALANVWYAISSHDLKTALAYHSIENIGIICVGMGVGLIAYNKYPLIAGLGLVASFYHLLNHSVFKSLLYLATGAIDHSTGQVVEFHRLGGLIKIYKTTSAMFLVGAFSIAGFPPFNGFIGEWLTLQALFAGMISFEKPFSPGLLVFLVSLVLLVLSFAMTAFCFYKIAGLTLLGECRTAEQEREKQGWAKSDVPWQMKGVMIIIGLFCLLLGVFPGVVIPALASLLQSFSTPNILAFVSLLQSFPIPVIPALALVLQPFSILCELPVVSWTGWKNIFFKEGTGLDMGMLLLAAFAIILVSLLILVMVTGRRKTAAKKDKSLPPWNCGAPLKTLPASQPTGSTLSFLLRDLLDVFPSREPARKEKKEPTLPQKLRLSHSEKYPQEVIESFRCFYNYIIEGLLSFSEWVGRTVQNKDIRRYLKYIFIANLIALLLFILLGK